MSELTDADRFELVEARHKDRGDVTEHVTIDRWIKYGKDRLYLNGLKTGDGWLSLKTGDSGGDKWTKVSADYELEGDELTITVGNRSTIYTLVVRVHGDDFGPVEDDGDEDEDNPVIVADGGEDVTEHFDDETIEDAIQQHDDHDHEDALSVPEVRDILVKIQQSVEEFWGEWVDNIESGDSTVVAETEDLIILDTGEINVVHQEMEHHPDIDDDQIARSIVTTVMHQAIPRSVDHDYQVTYPFIVRKPENFDAGQEYVETVVNGLQRRGLSPGQAWAYYGVDIRGNSRNSWGVRKGDHDHKNVSDALEKAKAKLP